MTTFVYIGKNAPGTSMHLVGTQVAAGIPDSIVVSNLQNVRAGDLVVSLIFDDTEKVLGLRRYVGQFKYVCLLAGHPADLGDYGVLHQLLHFTDHPLVCISDRMKTYMLDLAKKYLSPMLVRKLSERVSVIHYGLEEGFLPGPYEDVRSLQWVVPANRMGMTDKNLTKHARICNLAGAMLAPRLHGEPWQHLMYLSKAGRKPLDHPDFKRTEFPDLYTLLEQPDSREEYKANARRLGGFLCTSTDESFGIYYLELLFSGCVGVFYDRPWVRQLLGDYPWLASSDKDLATMMGNIVINHRESREYLLNDIVPKLREKYSLSKFQSEFLTYLRHLS